MNNPSCQVNRRGSVENRRPLSSLTSLFLGPCTLGGGGVSYSATGYLRHSFVSTSELDTDRDVAV